jgi:acyl carrier protein
MSTIDKIHNAICNTLELGNPVTLATEEIDIALATKLDSLNTIELIAELESVFNINFQPNDLQLKNFQSVTAIAKVVSQRISS